MKPTKANFVTCVRNAIAALGCSSKQALNVVNSALGQMELSKVGEDKTGDIKVKIPKSDSVESTASVNVKPGSETYKSRLSAALMFAAWNDALAKAEKLCPTMTVSIEPDSMFGKWLKQVAPGKTGTDSVPSETVPNSEQVTPTDTTTVSQ